MAPCSRCADKGNFCHGFICKICGCYDNAYSCLKKNCDSCEAKEELKTTKNGYDGLIQKIYEILSNESRYDWSDLCPYSIDEIKDTSDICLYIEGNYRNLVEDTKSFKEYETKRTLAQMEFEEENCKQQ